MARTYGRTLQTRVGRGDERRLDSLSQRMQMPLATLLRHALLEGLNTLEKGEPEHLYRERIVTRLDAIELATRAMLRQLYEGTGATPEQALEVLAGIDRAVRDRADARMRSAS